MCSGCALCQGELLLSPPCTSELQIGSCYTPFTPFAAGLPYCILPPPPRPSPRPCNNPQPLRSCFFRFDGLRSNGSSLNRFCGHGRCTGGAGLFLYFFLTGTRSTCELVQRFASIAVHLPGLTAYLFALLLFREVLRGLKNL